MNHIINKLAKTICLAIFVMPLIFTSCKKDEPVVTEAQQFVYDYTNFWYLWTDKIPTTININDYSNPEDLFDAMIYRTLDHWSFISDNYQEVLNSFNGIQTTPGYLMKLFKYSQNNNLFGVLEYVYDGGPADNAGLVRGNVIIKVNGQQLNTSNYNELLNQESLQLGLGQISGNDIIDLGTSVNITAVEMAIEPVQQYKVINAGGEKIGYLLYDQFTQDLTGLQSAVNYFNTQGINDMVLDLRYNPGGYVSTCSELASMLAPQTAINDTFIVNKWNTNATQYLIDNYGANSDLFVQMLPSASVNLNLPRMVVLTSNRTASASELIINGLNPYMDIITIGSTTVGKYTGGLPFYDENSATNTYCIYLMVLKIANSKGVTDYTTGFAPDYPVIDDYTTPLGNVNEPLLAKAIEVLTGAPPKKTSHPFNFIPYDKIDKNLVERNGLLINDFKLLKK